MHTRPLTILSHADHRSQVSSGDVAKDNAINDPAAAALRLDARTSLSSGHVNVLESYVLRASGGLASDRDAMTRPNGDVTKENVSRRTRPLSPVPLPNARACERYFC